MRITRPIYANSPITFGGVPHNFNYTQQQQPPMSGGGAAPVPTPSPITPGTSAAPNTDPLAPQNQNANPGQSPSPLDKYKDFFNNTNNSNQPPNNNQPPAPSVLDANAQHYAKVAEKMSFTSNITPEQKAAMAVGGEEGVNAMMAVIDSIGRNIYAQAGATASSVTKKGVELTKAEIDAKATRALTLAQSTSEISSTNAILQDPIYKPMVSAVQAHFLSIKPELTPKELAELTVGYFDNMARKTAGPTAQQQQQQSDPTGMEDFFKDL